MIRYETRTPAETIEAGKQFANDHLRSGMVIVLRGEMGAGKTHFVKGLAVSLGIAEDELTSPTYALANEYECVLNGAAFTLFHLDCYRFERPEELLELGVEDYLYPTRGATVVEWPERIEHYLPAGYWSIEIASVSETERLIVIEHTV